MGLVPIKAASYKGITLVAVIKQADLCSDGLCSVEALNQLQTTPVSVGVSLRLKPGAASTILAGMPKPGR
jgi:hypothetical protein